MPLTLEDRVQVGGYTTKEAIRYHGFLTLGILLERAWSRQTTWNISQVATISFVVAELNRKGAYATSFAGNLPGMDIIASNVEKTRKAFIQVKTKITGTWQTTNNKGMKRNPAPNDRNFWVFVDIKPENPDYYIVPEWWIQNDIHEACEKDPRKLKENKAQTKAEHHSIGDDRIRKWKDRWDILRLF
jgi:hypothetical protein